MTTKELVLDWFAKWDSGDFKNLPLSDDFQHTSPYGTINGKAKYLGIAEANLQLFLGNEIQIHDQLFEDKKAAVRYTLQNKNKAFTMEVSEWFYISDGLIKEIVAYYNIDGEISEDRQLSSNS